MHVRIRPWEMGDYSAMALCVGSPMCDPLMVGPGVWQWGGCLVESGLGAPQGAAGDFTRLAGGANIATQPDEGKRASKPPRSIW